MHNRRQFLRLGGLATAASLWPFGRLSASTDGDCTLIPSETAGPFPLDLSENEFYFRQDVREDRDGVQLNLKLRITGTDNCEPMSNVRVNIWHCDKDGNYSGYGSETELTYLRGYQIADENGEVEFITIFPGWYPGRTCHIHFQVYVNSSYAAISQLTWEQDIKNELYAEHADIYTAGTDPVSPGSDGIFADGYAFQTATLTPNTDTGGYDAFLELSVQGSGTATGYLEMEAAKRFDLGQNFPNPADDFTSIPFTLLQEADVTLEVYALNGSRLFNSTTSHYQTGSHTINLKRTDGPFPSGNHILQLRVRTNGKDHTAFRMMYWK